MANLIVLGFDDMHTAATVRDQTDRLIKENLLALADMAVVVRTQDAKVKIDQALNLTAVGASSGALWGLLIGTLFLSPLVGAAVGAASGAVGGKLTDIGINDDTIKEIGDTLRPGTSALFMLVTRATPDRVIAEIQPYHPRVIQTSLSFDDEAALVNALSI